MYASGSRRCSADGGDELRPQRGSSGRRADDAPDGMTTIQRRSVAGLGGRAMVCGVERLGGALKTGGGRSEVAHLTGSNRSPCFFPRRKNKKAFAILTVTPTRPHAQSTLERSRYGERIFYELEFLSYLGFLAPCFYVNRK
ncbi:molybdenum cofactor biosynthesis protein B [Striga asiatica]|uniref:Molybdenum cofactor biosynthesis protein B n=1 Tax=Striga asiatica TaxID=4170 RepID=A0A5A7Q6F0_STRAF|nr:molybdenum cofactor biosynthesis protein B [Striga asiatica]